MFARTKTSAPSCVRVMPSWLRSLSDFSWRASWSRRSRKRRDDALGRLAPDEPVPAVDHDAVALRDFREELRHADHRGKAEGTGEDRGVGRAAAALGHEGHDAVARDAHGIGRRELVRHEDDRLSREVLHPQARVLFAAEVLLEDARDVVDVGSVMREILVRQTPEPRREVRRSFRRPPTRR